jgi:glycosyltransferase involved in cell wall biosynthesis
MEGNKRKKILFLSHYFPPEVNAPANRTFENCKIWVKEHHVTVLTNFPNHPDGKIFPGYKNRQSKKEVIEGINVVRLFTFTTANEGVFLRTINFIWFMFAAVFYAVLSRIEFDVVIATTPQFFCGLAGKYISKLRRKPFILELRDLWPESIVAVGAITNKNIIGFLEHRAQKLYESATKIVTVTRSFRDLLIKRNIPPSKIETVFNGISLDMFTDYSNISSKEIQDFLTGGYKIGYIGTIGMAHSITTLVKAAERLKGTDIKFIVIGSGAERQKLNKEIYERSIRNIKIFPIQPKNEIPAIIHSLDVFCVHLKKNEVFKTVIPSKMFEGMIMEKPLLFGVDGESRRIIEDAKCGLYFEPENVDDLLNKINQLKSDPIRSSEMGRNGYRFAKENFNRDRLAQVYLQIILSVIGDQ